MSDFVSVNIIMFTCFEVVFERVLSMTLLVIFLEQYLVESRYIGGGYRRGITGRGEEPSIGACVELAPACPDCFPEHHQH